MHFKEYESILSPQNGMNIYRGCTHGCIYCDSRSSCYHIGHAFTDVEIKADAPRILDLELSKKRRRVMVGTGSMTDPYCLAEDVTHYTRQCLEVICRQYCGVSLLTKSAKVLNDLDLLIRINQRAKTIVQMTLTTADDTLCRKLEPHVSPTSERVAALKKLREAGIETVVWLSPFLPYINDTEDNLLRLLDFCADAGVYGVIFFGVGLTLRDGNRKYFYSQLDRLFPGLSERYREEFGDRYEVMSHDSFRLTNLVLNECRKRNIVTGNDFLFKRMHELPGNEQMTLI